MLLRSPRLPGRQRKEDGQCDDEEKKQEEEEGEETHYSGASSFCPSCRRGFDIALLLPCSHTLCGRCVEGGVGVGAYQPLCTTHVAKHKRSASPPVCAVLCPCCRHPVELPCWEWASATDCLPHDPTLTPGCVNHYRSRDTGDVTEQGTPNVPSSPSSPMDGAIDLREEEMEQSVSGLTFSLDPSAAAPSLRLSNSFLTVTFQEPSPPPLPSLHHGNRSTRSVFAHDPMIPQVCADMIITRGQFYWEVDVCNSTLYRIGVSSLDGSCGWWLERQGISFSTVYDGRQEPLRAVPPQLKTLGVFLNMGGGALSFHNTLTQEHLATLPTRFSLAGVRPALGLGQGRLRLRCGLPPPSYIFLSRASAYRGPSGAGGGRWRRDVPFHSVRTVIQKFEELAVSDSDSGLVSSFGSSFSTLTSCLTQAQEEHCSQGRGQSELESPLYQETQR